MLQTVLFLVLVGTVQDVREWTRRGMEKVLNRDFPGANEDLSRAIEMDPKEWRIYGLRGKVRKELGDLDGAIADYTKVIDLNPSHSLAYTGRAEARQEKKDLDGAIRDYSEALRLEPRNADHYLNRGAVKILNSDPDGAVTDFKKAIEINPKEPLAHHNLGSAYLEKKDFEPALAAFSKAIELDPRAPSAYHMRAMAQYKKGDYAAALRDADRAIQLDAGDPDFHYMRACCLMAKDSPKEAKASFDRALKAADESWTYRRRSESLVSVLPELTGGSSTVPFRRRVLEKGRELLSKGDTDKGIEVLEEAVRLDVRSPEPYEVLAGAYLKRNDQNRGDNARAQKLVWDVIEFGKGLSPQMQRHLTLVSSPVLLSLRWLAHHQMTDGRFSGESVVEACRKDGTPQCDGKGTPGSDLRATSLAILAFQGAAYSFLNTDNYDTKPLGETVKKALQWMLAHQNADGSLGDPSSARFLEDHAIATLAFSEAYGLPASYEPWRIPATQFLKGPTQKAVDFLVASQGPQKGWAVQSRKEGPDPMATGWALFALKSAVRSELKVPADTLRQGLEWMISATLKARPPDRDMAGLLGIAVASFLGNKPDGAVLVALLKPLSDAPPGKEAEDRDALLTYLSAVALRLGENDTLWKSWRDRAKTALVQAARFDDEGNGCPAGSWDAQGPTDGPRGRVITTALNIMTLEIIYRYATVFCLPPAESDSARAIERNPRNAAAFYDRGNVKKDRGDLDGAIADYTRAIQSNPKDAGAYANRGAAKWAKGDLDGSIADSTCAIERDPKQAMAYYNRGGAKQAKGDLDGALADYTRAIEIDPKYADAYNNRGTAKLNKGDQDGAIADYTLALKSNPTKPSAYYNRGNVKRVKEDWDGAVADYDRAVELDPQYAAAYVWRGYAKQAKGNLDGALADYTRAIKIDPKRPSSYYNRGNGWRAKGDWDEALADYTRAIEIAPTYADAYFSRGDVKQAKEDWDGSISDYTRAIEIAPNFAAAYLNRGYLFYNRGSWSEALADYRKTVELDPSRDYPRFCAWLTRSRLNERDAATEELARYLADRKIGKPDDWPSKIARLLTGDLREADFLKAAESKDPKTDRDQKCEAYFYAGSRRLLEGDKIGAKTLLQKCLDTRVTDLNEYASAAAELKRLGN